MRQKDSPKSCGCFGSLFRKKPSGHGKGKNASGRSKIIRAASNHLLSSSRKKSGSPKKAQVSTNGVVQKSDGEVDRCVTTTELQTKIIGFRELINLPPFIGSSPIIELVKDTVKELHNLHPDVVPYGSVTELDSGAMHKAINELCESIEALGKYWMHSDEWMVKSKKNDEVDGDLEKHALDLLDDIIKVARESMFNILEMDNDKEVKEDVDSPSTSYGKSSRRSNSEKERCISSPTTPTSVLSKFPNNKSAKMDPQPVKMDFEANGQRFSVDEGTNKDGNSDGLVRAQMEISIPPSLLKSIVDAENVMIHTAGSPSSSSERPSISAAIITPPQQLLVSEESQSPPRPLPPPPCLAVKESDTATPVPPPPPPPSSMTTSDTTSLSAPPPPPAAPAAAAAPPPPMASSDDSAPPQQAPLTTSDEATSSPSSPARPPPPPPPMVPGSPPPPPAPAAPKSNPPPATTPGLPPLPPSAPGIAMPGSLGPQPPPPPPTASGSIPPPPPPSSGGSVNAPPTPASGSIPPPPPVSSKGGAPAPPPPGQKGKGGAPPPPPVGGNGKLLKKSVSKLKRSSQMGCLYRQLKAKVEGSSSKGVPGKSPQKKGNKVGASTGNGKQGMADALAEMTKRSSYFQQIEEDVKKYSGAVREVKVALAAFQTTDMDELIKFHKYVESHLEKLTDETQVLARFEDFPGKKLEGLRMAGALYSKLDTIYKDLQNWKIEPPANDLLDRVENYFNKIKEDIDTLDRTKDDEIKKFKSQKIHFDFGILIRIKESMVDVSSSCMEMALKEKKESSSSKKNKNSKKTASSEKILWKAFQFAFRVYSFAGGQDERAENLTREIAQQIQAETLQ
ncbi:hypothetical protein L2E82_40081 [Cichorium intybus]|uniref:Uncharacterized protein n=1 Tax=Cichorium intybus TaxID=13427 RepID=A0ACB9AKR3_CICIN|nr:hypothetical protein L2E82_40081 [Cichorium intybus]